MRIPNINCKYYIKGGFCEKLPKILWVFKRECIKLWANRHCDIQNKFVKPKYYKMEKWKLKDGNGNYIYPLQPQPPKARIIKEGKI